MPKREGLTPLRLVKNEGRDPPTVGKLAELLKPSKGDQQGQTARPRLGTPRRKELDRPQYPQPESSKVDPPEWEALTINGKALSEYLKRMKPAPPAGPLDEAAKRRARNSGRSLDIRVKRGTLCVVKSGEDIGPSLSAGHVVRFIRAPIPGTAVAVFQYGPGVYAFSKSDGSWVGKDNAHYCCLIDRTKLRLLEPRDLEGDSESLALLNEIMQQHEQDDKALAAKQAQLFLLLTSSRRHGDSTLSEPIATQPARQVQLATPAEQSMANKMDAGTLSVLRQKAKQATDNGTTEQ